MLSRASMKWLIVAALFTFCIAPTFISYRPYRYTWDDANSLSRAIAVSRAFWSGNTGGLNAMVEGKPPVMNWLGLPWGMPTSWEVAGDCFITLATVMALLMAACFFFLLRLGVKPVFLVLAAVCVAISLGPYPERTAAHSAAIGFLADNLVAWTSLAAVLLIPLEGRSDSDAMMTSILLGALWALVFSLGTFTKMTFLYFIVLVLPVLFFIRLRRQGPRRAVATLVAFVCFSLPCILYYSIFGRPAFQHAQEASFGRAGSYFHHPLLQLLVGTARESPGIPASVAAVVVAIVYLSIRKRIAVMGLDFLAFLITVGFGLLVLTGDAQVRFLFPAFVGLPFLAAVLLSGRGQPVARRSAALAAGLVFCALLAASLPMRYRPDGTCLSRCNSVLSQAAACHARHILLATDSPTLNRSLMRLAVEVSPPAGWIQIGTLAYQVMLDRPIEDDFASIGGSDAVFFQDKAALSPPFTNSRVSQYEAYVRNRGCVPARIGPDLSVYVIHCSN